jgi:hypothetical protein
MHRYSKPIDLNFLNLICIFYTLVGQGRKYGFLPPLSGIATPKMRNQIPIKCRFQELFL